MVPVSSIVILAVDASAVMLNKSIAMVPLEIIISAEAIATAAIGYMVTKSSGSDNTPILKGD